MRRKSLLVILLAVILAGPGITSGVAGSKIRGHKVHSGSSSHDHYRSSYGYRHHGYGRHTYIGVGYSGYYGYYPYYAYPYPLYSAPVYAGVYSSPVSYIDTDVKPEKAAVFIDGDYVGIADSFDGFPRYLTTEPGRHTITFEMEGYKTWTRTLKIPAGGITKLRIKMSPGEGIDEGDQRDLPAEVEPVDEEGEQSEVEISRPSEGGPGFIRLKISPEQAAVYLDGEFYAPASTLGRLHGDLRLESGVHVIEVVMPGYQTSTRRVELAAGDRLTLSIELRKDVR